MGLKYEDYAHLAQNNDNSEEAVVDKEIQQAAQQQEDRQSTPDTDWESRYKELEKAYSRQGQQLGDYRKLVDNYVSTGLDSTPSEPESSQEVSPITPDDIYENPDEAVRRAVDSHPAIRRAQKLEEEFEQRERQTVMDQFRAKHPTFEEDVQTPEFVNWVKEDPTRFELLKRADQFDMIAADALFTMWESMQAPQNSGPTIDEVALESGTGAEAAPEERYSRSEMLQVMTRAKQGDQKAIDFYNAHAAAYREALAAGNVRD